MDDIFRFARFEADRGRYQLRRGTSAIKLERIPLELLFLLLEYNGKLVPRGQIVARLWGDKVFLDTERSINTAIRKIRKALGDDPHHPQFIETIVAKGYRFIAPLLPSHATPHPNPGLQPAGLFVDEVSKEETSEIRLRRFLVESVGGAPVLTCDIMVSNIPLGRLPLLELTLPADVTLPLQPSDRLLLNLHGVRVTLAAKAAQALHAFAISVLQNGLRTRVTDSPRLSEESQSPSLPESTSRQFLAPQKSQSVDTH